MSAGGDAFTRDTGGQAWLSRSAEETCAIGAEIGAGLRGGDVVLISGDLGAGKTELTKGIATALGVVSLVQSPTFALVDEHAAAALGRTGRLVHLDLYRLEPEQLDEIGWDELTSAAEDVVVVEWAERAAGRLPERYVLIEIASVAADARAISITRVAGRSTT